MKQVETDDYTRPSAVESLVWYMFEDFTTPQIYHLLSLLAEQDGITAEDISEAWRAFDILRQLRLDTNVLY